MASELTTLFRYDTEFSADSIEWCPIKPFQNRFVCANYYLKKEESAESQKQTRLGRILLFSISPGNNLELLKTLNTHGVLDQKWSKNTIKGNSILGVVNSENTIEIYKLSTEGDDLILLVKFTIQAGPDVSSTNATEDGNSENLILSLDWSNGKYASDTPEIVCSDSMGCVHVLQFDGENLTLLNSVKSHGFEAWIAAFYYWDVNVYFSGGDDSLLFKYDKRTGKVPISKNRSHEAGVTCIHSNKDAEFTIASGSYDTYLRIWDIRYMKTPQKSLETPGTLWRIKWHPEDSKQLLIACMLGGVHVVSDEDPASLEIVRSYGEHKNIAYGADWCCLSRNEVREFDDDARNIVGSCSFYDHLLCVSVLK